MNILVLCLLAVASFYVTLRRGPGAAFVYVLIPSLLFFSQIPVVMLGVVPDLDSRSAITYAVIAAMLLAGKLPTVRWHWIDTCVVLLTASQMITALTTGEFWTLVSILGEETLRWLMPYYMARVAFMDPLLRRHAALVLAFCLMPLGMMAAIEFRLWPNFFSQMLEQIGLSAVMNNMAMSRFGFFRAMATAAHPIDLGNSAVVASAMLVALATASGLKIRDWRIAGGLAGGCMTMMAAMSFSSYAAAITALMVFCMLRFVRFGGELLGPSVLVIAVALFAMSHQLLTDTSARPQNDALGDSYWVRALIMQRAAPFVGSAGAFGHGFQGIPRDQLQLDSVDNAYLVFVLTRGWIYLALWVLLVFSVAAVAARALRRHTSLAARLPVAAAMAGLVGLLVGIYTVWFGFNFAILWALLLGVFVSMTQVLRHAPAAATVSPPRRPVDPRPIGPMPYAPAAMRTGPGR